MMQARHFTRRSVLRGAALTGAAIAASACGLETGSSPIGSVFGVDHHSEGRFSAMPVAAPTGELRRGLHPFGLSNGETGLLLVPKTYRPDVAMPFTVGFHGASGHAKAGLRAFGHYADARGIVILCPRSQFPSWDVIYGGFGPDVATIDDAMQRVFDRMIVDRAHLAATGFSDGASYALSVGLINGDLFSHVVSLSPGFRAPGPARGKPAVFIAHGTQDRVLPIDRTSRRIVPELRDEGYDVHYEEFHGRHEVLPSETRDALRWFLG